MSITDTAGGGRATQQLRSWKQLLSMIAARLCVQTNLLLGKLPAVKNRIPTPSHSLLAFSLAKRVAENAEAPVGESLSFCEPLTAVYSGLVVCQVRIW